jgi:hypothetical protein
MSIAITITITAEDIKMTIDDVVLSGVYSVFIGHQF